MKCLAICSLSLAILLPGQVGGAESRVRPVEVTLAIPAGAPAADVLSMLTRQARQVCTARAVYPHTHMDEERRCRAEFVAAAVARIDDDSLTRVHAARTGAAVPAGHASIQGRD